MVFGFILLLIFSAQALFSYSFFSSNSLFVQLFGVFQFLVFSSSLSMMIYHFRRRQTTNYKKAFYAFGAMIGSGVPALVYLLPGLIHLFSGNELVRLVGWIGAGLLFLGILFGIFVGRWSWKTHEVTLEFDHLPETMDGVKIVQISDVHVGSFFQQYQKVKRAIDKINHIGADYVFFTGDLVNNVVAEMHGWEDVFGAIEAKKGKFSILGNHDYGDYVPWDADEKKQANLKALVEMHRTIGFTPLLNESVQLTDEENGFWLLGVENWGKAPFRQSGKLKDTLNGIPENAFKLLLSHDPSHFDEQVVPQSNVDLTLSGHTHGMQFGIERWGIKWSPVSFRYKKWAGLYQEGKQFLYVNRGFGYLGFPGRVGIYPEITSIVLKRKR